MILIIPNGGRVHRGRPEALDGEPDAEHGLEERFWEGQRAGRAGELREQLEQFPGPRDDGERARDEAQHGDGPWHQAGPVHQVTEYQPVFDSWTEPGAEQERPLMDGDQRLADDNERGGVAAASR